MPVRRDGVVDLRESWAYLAWWFGGASKSHWLDIRKKHPELVPKYRHASFTVTSYTVTSAISIA